MMLQAALNGPLTKADHPAVPISANELARDVALCAAAGAGSVHLHPRDADGLERLDAGVVDPVVARVRGAASIPISVSTGAWIEPDVQRRVALVRSWTQPDLATVNLGEEGAIEVMRALLVAGVGIEAGVWSAADAEVLARSGLGPRVARVLVEPVDVAAGAALEVVRAIHDTLDDLALDAPRLEHGDGEAAWLLVEDAIARGIDTRIGLEDTSYGPSGDRVDGNEALVLAARALGAG